MEQIFGEQFGGSPQIITIAPGRVNLIGEHTDYNEGFVFPAAIDRSVKVAARIVRTPSQLYSDQKLELGSFETAELGPGRVSDWPSYAAGVAWSLQEHTGVKLPNIEAAIDSTIPMGSGVSSSAAIELAFAVAWNSLARLDLTSLELARICQRAENEFVGVNCGMMDQLASALGRSGCAMFIDTKSLDITYAEIPDDLVIVLCDTGKPRSLSDSAYNERRAECELAAKTLGVTSLRNAKLDTLESRWTDMSETVYKRAHHVITENARCISFVDALDKCNHLKIRMLMRASHESLRDHFEVSSPELDQMAEAAWGAPGCIGARMTGAGFGGACVALVEESRVDSFIRSTQSRYSSMTGLEGKFTACRPARGAHVLDPALES